MTSTEFRLCRRRRSDEGVDIVVLCTAVQQVQWRLSLVACGRVLSAKGGREGLLYNAVAATFGLFVGP